MAVELVVLLLVFVVGIFIVHKLLQEAIDLAHVGISILGIVIALAFIALVFDAVSFRRGFSASDSVVVFTDDNFGVESGGLATDSAFKELSGHELEELSSSVSSKDYQAALGNKYKLILVKKAVISNNSDNMHSVFLSLINNPSLLASEFSRGNVVIYPETVTFKIIRLIPFAGISEISSKGKGFLAGLRNES